MKAYFDGGNEADSTQYNTVTLVAFAATDPVWRAAEKAWRSATERYGAKYIHMFEAISLTREFDKRKGWDWSRVHRLLDECVKVFRAFRSRPLFSTSCTVFLKDHLYATTVVPGIPCVEYICTGGCFTTVMNWYAAEVLKLQTGADFPDDRVDLFFDQGEPFRGHVVDQWNQKRIRKRDFWRGVRSVSEAEMRVVPGLQMADMLAWAYNRPHGASGYEELCQEIVTARKDVHFELTYDRLVKPHPERFEAYKKLSLPKRKPAK